MSLTGMSASVGLGRGLGRCTGWGCRLDLCAAVTACMVEFVKLPG
jgi:hypothetical protein